MNKAYLFSNLGLTLLLIILMRVTMTKGQIYSSIFPIANHKDETYLSGPNVCYQPKKKTMLVNISKEPECSWLDKIKYFFTRKCKPYNTVENREIEVKEAYCCNGFHQFNHHCLPCRNMTWGPSCKYRCECNGNVSFCDPVNGSCKCPPGWMGNNCGTACPEGYYGSNCIGRCNCENNICDKLNGTCLANLQHDCSHKPGYYGNECQYECQDGKFGVNCESSCNHGCRLSWDIFKFMYPNNISPQNICHHSSGSCICPPGRKGKFCNETCDFGLYGINCENACECSNLESVVLKGNPHDLYNFSSFDEHVSYGDVGDGLGILLNGGDNKCDTVTGECKCSPGYSGILCQNRFCPSGHYVNNSSQTTTTNTFMALSKPPSQNTNKPAHEICNSRCECDTNNYKIGEYSKHSDCHPFTGKCQCGNGRFGAPDCDIRCPLKTIRKNIFRRTSSGINCQKNCQCGPKNISLIPENGVYNIIFECHPITGECICPPGFFGKECENICPPNMYGINCKSKCACKGGKCDPFDGRCTKCPPGLFGNYCNSKCPDNLWGDDCSKKCHCSKSGSSCDQKTGQCLCLNGFLGKDCTEKCPKGFYGQNCSESCDVKNRCPWIYSYNQETCNNIHGSCICFPNTQTTYKSNEPIDVFNDFIICGNISAFIVARNNYDLYNKKKNFLLWIILIPILIICSLFSLIFYICMRKKNLIKNKLKTRLYDSYELKNESDHTYEMEYTSSPIQNIQQTTTPLTQLNVGTCNLEYDYLQNNNNIINKSTALIRLKNDLTTNSMNNDSISSSVHHDITSPQSNLAKSIIKDNNIQTAHKLNNKLKSNQNIYEERDDPYYMAFTTKKNFSE